MRPIVFAIVALLTTPSVGGAVGSERELVQDVCAAWRDHAMAQVEVLIQRWPKQYGEAPFLCPSDSYNYSTGKRGVMEYCFALCDPINAIEEWPPPPKKCKPASRTPNWCTLDETLNVEAGGSVSRASTAKRALAACQGILGDTATKACEQHFRSIVAAVGGSIKSARELCAADRDRQARGDPPSGHLCPPEASFSVREAMRDFPRMCAICPSCSPCGSVPP